MKNRNTTMVFTLLLLVCFVVLPKAHAVVPPPDGGYPGGNTAEGQTALLSLTTGGFNTAIGFLSLRSNMTNSFNTAVGAGTLLANSADQNTATGAGALLSNTTGDSNTANGSFALFSNTQGSGNTAVGTSALQSNIAGSGNTANGYLALALNTTGVNNTAIGFDTLLDNTGGNGNTAIGRGALSATTGDGNTALGANAGNALTTGVNNIDIGVNVIGMAGESNTIRIGNTGIAATFIRGISGTAITGTAVVVDTNGQLGVAPSSKRFKEDIKPMDKVSETLLSLKPVTFRYKKQIDPTGTSQFGLVAEDVEKVNPDLVMRDPQGKPYTVRYEQINAMLLNEFLKEHRKVEKLEATVATLAAQLQRVTARLEMNHSDAQVVVNDQ